MGSTTFSITPAGGTQANDAEDMTNNDNNQSSITFPVDILITDAQGISLFGNRISEKELIHEVN